MIKLTIEGEPEEVARFLAYLKKSPEPVKVKKSETERLMDLWEKVKETPVYPHPNIGTPLWPKPAPRDYDVWLQSGLSNDEVNRFNSLTKEEIAEVYARGLTMQINEASREMYRNLASEMKQQRS